MARKVWYSKPLKYFWHHLYGTQRKLAPGYSDDQIFQMLRQSTLSAPLSSGEPMESRRLKMAGIELWRADLKGELLHIFFLDKQLRDFLEVTSLSDIEGIKKYLYEFGQSKEVFYIHTKQRGNVMVFCFGIHLPYESDGYAFSLSIEENGTLEVYFSHGEIGGQLSDKMYNDLTNKTDDHSVKIAQMYRLAINTIAYMNCFPECVTDGVPKNLFERGEDKSARNFTFHVSEKIREIDNAQLSKIPHFRKGHFRLLQSDYFVHKKGQLVFVAETMVKGKAKTVSTSSDLDKFGSSAEG